MDDNDTLEGIEDQLEDLNLTFDDFDENVLLESLRSPNEFSPSTSLSAQIAAAASSSSSSIRSSKDIENYDDSVDCSRFKSSSSTASSAAATAGESYYSTSLLESNDYILGTLIVRVVAARDLEPVRKQGLGDLLWGNTNGSSSNGKMNSSDRSRQGGTANPYASVRFGKTTQRTSEVPGTVDPVWPRGESMYMDVMHPVPEEETTNYNNNTIHKSDKKESRVPEKENHKIKESITLPDSNQKMPAILSQRSTNVEAIATNEVPDKSYQKRVAPKPLLTIAIFHVHEVGRLHKYPSKACSKNSGDSDDVFLGMATVDLTPLLTGKIGTFDQWLPLSGSSSPRAAVRVVCEYEASDAKPHPGDLVRFTDYCHPADLFPAVANGRVYTVLEVEGDEVIISWTSSEGWVSTYAVHRFMLICVERHHSVVDICQEELVNIRERLVHSPAIHAIQETVDRVPDEGLLQVTEGAIKNGLGLLGRWLEGGLETTTNDITSAINWDGRHNPNAIERLDMCEDDREEEENQKPAAKPVPLPTDASLKLVEPLPNMPACPITGEPMVDPVVAADGHTYERAAIARWLSESDKSPLTGSVLAHKDLVPNYMLLSSLQDAAMFAAAVAPPTVQEVSVGKANARDEDDVVTDIKID